MPKPRTPKAKATVTGQAEKKRTKFESRKEPSVNMPLGSPPSWVVDTETIKAKSAWELFQREIPWLNESHRLLVGMASNIQGRMMAGQEVGVQAMNLLRQMLGQMGATPATARFANAPEEPEIDDLLD